jgi:hypothetical protein
MTVYVYDVTAVELARIEGGSIAGSLVASAVLKTVLAG